jgi:hypothetical protein
MFARHARSPIIYIVVRASVRRPRTGATTPLLYCAWLHTIMPAPRQQHPVRVQVAAGATVATLTIPKGKCSTTACIYVHDGTFRRSSPAPAPGQASCISADNQRCQLCNYVNTKITIPGESCDDGFGCTDDVCSDAGECVGTPKDSKCDDNVRAPQLHETCKCHLPFVCAQC